MTCPDDLRSPRDSSGRDPATPGPAGSRGARPSITLVGAGRAGTALGRLLHRAGFPILAVVCRTRQSAERAVERIGGGWAASTTEEFPFGELLIFGVPDDALHGEATRLAGHVAPGSPRVALHLSGALGEEALEELREAGVATGSLHPIRAFPEGALPDSIEGTWFGLQGSAEALVAARGLVEALGGRHLTVRGDARPLYHAACCFASNAVVAALAEGLLLMGAAGVETGEAVAALVSLLRGSVEEMERAPFQALTGPVVRGDVETIRTHLAALERIGDGRGLRFYRAFSAFLAGLAEDTDLLSGGVADKIRSLLEEPAE